MWYLPWELFIHHYHISKNQFSRLMKGHQNDLKGEKSISMEKGGSGFSSNIRPWTLFLMFLSPFDSPETGYVFQLVTWHHLILCMLLSPLLCCDIYAWFVFSKLFINVGNINSTNINENVAVILLLLWHLLQSERAAFILWIVKIM